MAEKILEGIKVLDLSQFLSGPRCSQLLSLKGADVVKIEPPMGETMRILANIMKSERMMSTLHQNQRGVVIDLKKAEGREVFHRMADRADILVENFAPGLMKKLELDFDHLRESNPRLIYVSISGFGRTGPYSDRTAFDIIAQASSGIMHAYKMQDRPPKVYFGDLVSGAYAALGAMEALLYRERTGKGQLVDISMQDVMYFQNFSCFTETALEPVSGEIEKMLGTSLSGLLTDDSHPKPFWSSFRAKDGYVVIVALTDREWQHFMEVIGREDMITDPRFNNFLVRVQNDDEGMEQIKPWIAERTTDEVVAALEAKNVPCAKVADFDEVNNSEQLKARGMITEVDDKKLGPIKVPGDPIRLSDVPNDVHSPCPHLGEHTDEVLKDWLKLADAEIAELRKKNAVK